MISLNSNINSLYAQQALNFNQRGIASVMEQLSTGKRINNAADDVAGLAITTRLTAQIKGLNQAVRNANDAISLIQTADGATEQITNMLQRMNELALQASTGTNDQNQATLIDKEFQQLKQEIDRISQNTQWNGSNILDGTGGAKANGVFQFQVGANPNQTISITLRNIQTAPDGTNQQTYLASTSSGATSADFNYTGLDGNETSVVGLLVQSVIDNHAVQYKITQDDVDHALMQGAYAGGAGQNLSKTVADAIAGKFRVSLGTANATVDSTNTSGHVEITATATTSLDPFVASGSPGANMSSSFVAGDLNAVATSTITNATNANQALQDIASALQSVSADRATMGAVVSRLQFASDNLTNVSAHTQASESTILDTDYAAATTELAKRTIIQQAAQAVLAQANQQPQWVIQMLKNM
jgi:flagellin